jgi:hypothetical protein
MTGNTLTSEPFSSSRSLWVIFIGKWGIWTHATLPVDDRLGIPDKENITGLCDLVGRFTGSPGCHRRIPPTSSGGGRW